AALCDVLRKPDLERTRAASPSRPTRDWLSLLSPATRPVDPGEGMPWPPHLRRGAPRTRGPQVRGLHLRVPGQLAASAEGQGAVGGVRRSRMSRRSARPVESWKRPARRTDPPRATGFRGGTTKGA